MEKVYEYLKKCGVYYLATTDGDQPRVRPFGTIDIFEGKLYFQTGKSKPVADQLKANPRIEISGMADQNTWIRLSGKAILDDNNIPAQEHMLEAYPDLKAMYQPGDGNIEEYYITEATATICSFTEPPVVIKF